jgi:DAPG hydrolase PhiG domain
MSVLCSEGVSMELSEELAIQFRDPAGFGRALLQHCYNEFTFLSRFLPSLFAGAHRDARPPELPW